MSREAKPPSPLLVVLSGLSGAGKDAVLDGLRRSELPLEFIVTATTRPRRADEVDGVHYRFLSVGEFRSLIAAGELMEWAEVYGNYYGVPKAPVRQALAAGKDVIVKVDVQGAETIKKLVPQALFIFLVPPSMEELEQRLKGRRTESPEQLALRMETARAEMEKLHIFDHVVVNRAGELEQTVADVAAIIEAEKNSLEPRQISI